MRPLLASALLLLLASGGGGHVGPPHPPPAWHPGATFAAAAVSAFTAPASPQPRSRLALPSPGCGPPAPLGRRVAAAAPARTRARRAPPPASILGATPSGTGRSPAPGPGGGGGGGGGPIGEGDRFSRVAPSAANVGSPCIVTIDGARYSVTAWARAHPGGEKVLLKFHGRDATRAFEAAGHSDMAYAMLRDFEIGPGEVKEVEEGGKVDSIVDAASESDVSKDSAGVKCPMPEKARGVPRWRSKLFTSEDPMGVHKYMGVFSLLHFAYRYRQMLFGDPSCGLGTRMGRGPSVLPALCVIPHGVLSLSSLIFHTVPRERVVGKPMIWQEFRAHNIIFGVRSVLTTALAWACLYSGQNPSVRRAAVALTACSVIAANAAADVATSKLRSDDRESTTATMPYWDGCSTRTQRRFKSFYAYSQFLATLACTMCSNPAWPLSVLLAIQLASLLMTLVRKGIISARAYHMAYTASLCMPYLVGLRHHFIMRTWDFPAVLLTGTVLYQLRRRGVNKYALWAPVVAARIAVGDRFINYSIW